MGADNDIRNELQTLSPLVAKIARTNIFSLPEKYFELLISNILAHLTEDLVKNPQQTFQVPIGYFNNLSTEILNKVNIVPSNAAATELKDLSPLLYSIRHINVFKASPEYFNELPKNFLTAKLTPSTKVVTMLKLRQYVKYAAAAVLIGVIGLSTNKLVKNPFFNQKPSNYGILTPFIEKGKTMNEAQFNKELTLLSNEDISAYLVKNGSEEDISSITSNLKEDTLPNKDDYFLDEKTLENYLGSIE